MLRDNNEKENVDAAQLELDRGGEGARKRVRTRVFINGKGEDVLWAEEKELVVVDGVVSPRKVDEELSIGGVGVVVPRKRTNANHLVTPKRGVKRMPLQTLGGDLKVGLGAQMLSTSPKKIVLGEKVDEEEKPARRRKSMRKSGVRRLTSTIFEKGNITPLVDIPANTETVSESVVSEKETGQEILAEGLADSTPNLEIEQAVENVADVTPEVPELVAQDTAIRLESAREFETVQEFALSNLITDALDESTIDISLAISDSNIQQATETAEVEEHMNAVSTELELSTSGLQPIPELPQTAIDIESTLITIPNTTLQTAVEDGSAQIQPDSTTLTTTFVSLNADGIIPNPIFSPTKVPATPRRGKKSATQPQSIRRSTRSKPASAPVDSNTLNEIQPVELLQSPVRAVVEEQLVIEAAHETTKLSELVLSSEKPVSLSTTEAEVTSEETEPVSDISTVVELSMDVLPIEDASNFETLTNDAHEGTHISLPSLCEISNQAEGLEDSIEADFDVNQSESHCDESSSDKPKEDDATDLLEGTTIDLIASNNGEDSGEANPEENGSILSSSESLSEEETITQDLEVTVLESDVCLEIPFSEADDDSLLLSNQLRESMNESRLDDVSEEDPEEFEPVSFGTVAESTLDNATMELDNLPGSSTPDPSTTALVETISENAPSTKYDEDDTDLLRNFLHRVKANKEAKAQSTSGKRKRSLPHSPIQLPLGSELSSPQSKIDIDISVPAPSPAKRRKRGEPSSTKDDLTEPQSIRRSGRTRLPIMTSSLPAPSFIPVRRLGQDGDNTITLRKSEDKELAVLTKINTRKNKGTLSALDLLSKLSTQKDPVSRHQALKQKFDEKSQTYKNKSKKKKTVVWAEEIAQFQNTDEKELDAEKMEIAVIASSKEKGKEKKKEIAVSVAATPVKVVKEKKGIPVRSTSSAAVAPSVGADVKKTPVKVGVRSSRISMGMVANGTPAPKRKIRGSARP